jgi:hypothetical protein
VQTLQGGTSMRAFWNGCYLAGSALCLAAMLSAQANAQAVTPYVLWNTPAPTIFQTPLSALQLNAVVLAAPPVPVSLSSSFNLIGIVQNGTIYPNTQGFDSDGEAYSANVGTSVTWNGVNFALGPANVNDAVINGATIPIPAGKYSYLLMVADMVDNVSPQATFVVNYTDGTNTTATLSLSDWVEVKSTPGESRVACWPYRLSSNGAENPDSVCMDGYSIALDQTKTVSSVTVPNSKYYPVLSMVMLPAIVAGQGTYSPALGTLTPVGNNPLGFTFISADPAYANVSASVTLVTAPPSSPLVPVIHWATPAPILLGTPLSGTQLNAYACVTDQPVPVSLFNNTTVDVIFDDGTLYSHGGFGSNGYVYSAQQLGSVVTYAGAQFALGARNVPDAVTSTTIQALPPNLWTMQSPALYVIAAAANSAQLAQNFTVIYTDGTSTTQAVDMSSWQSPQNFPGETIVASTAYANTPSGGSVAGTFDLYGYQIALDPTKFASSIVLPNNANVIVLAMALAGVALQVPGVFVYNPPAGTVLPLGNNPLAVSFTPTDTVDIASATATNTLVVYQPTLVIEADNISRLYGTSNPVLTGTITGQQNGDQFTESFSTAAATLSQAGAYAITPSAAGPNLAAYVQTIKPGVLTIAQAPVTMGLSSSTLSALYGSSVMLSATVQSTTSGTPTGTVTFLCNGAAIGTATLSAGTAVFTTATLPLGADTITATYSGDVDFLPNATGGNPVSISINPQDFTLSAPNGTTLSTLYGGSPQLLLHIAPLNGTYSSNVVFTLSGPLALGATASFSPNPVPVNGGPTDVTLTIHTIRLASSGRRPGWTDLSGITLALLLLPLATGRRMRRTRGWTALLLLMSLGAVISLSGCGSGYNADAFPLTVTATSGVVQHSLQMTLQMEAGPQ